jgi:hypothetical protein
MSRRVECSKQVKLPGGFTYTVREARDDYPCFFCGSTIHRGTLYVEERFARVTRRYHYQCFNKVTDRVKAVETFRGVVLCVER